MAKTTSFQDVDSSELIAFADSWASLGDAVSSQVRDVLADADSWCEQNPNALRLAQERIGGYSEEIDEALADALKKFDEEDADPMEANESLKDYE